ncbi:hypothetical protein [Agromyces sp. SYSU T00194]|uniref:hypothetical protein n=1 Tax=Agromyces chitinivorans TaxID=3158560 RepID=UPI003394593A
MPSEFTVRALDSTVRIAGDASLAPEQFAELEAQWRDLVAPHVDSADRTIRVGLGAGIGAAPADGEDRVFVDSFEELCDRLATEVTLAGIRGLQGRALMLHAAAVDAGDGRVVGFVGPSGRGKTTVAQALGHDFGYVTDETLAVRPDGTVLSYRKPLSIGSRPGRKRTAPASDLGLRSVDADGLELAAVVLLDRRAEVATPWVESVPLAEGLPELVSQSSYLAVMPRPLRMLAEVVLAAGGIRRVVYGEATTLPPLIEELIATREAEPPMLVDVADSTEQGCGCAQAPSVDADAASVPRSGSYRREAHRDSLMLDERLYVLRASEVFVLEGLGPVVWLGADDSTEEDLREEALRQLPEPPEGVDPGLLVSAAIRDLLDAGLLTQQA